MSIKVRGKSDATIKQFVVALKSFQKDHPNAIIDLYRQWEFSISIRIIDVVFKDLDLVERHSLVEKYLMTIPEEPLSEVGMLVLITPQEKAKSMGNLEFEDPVPAKGLP